jgi:two-component system, OmpR family, phosphate regulon response regulator PhoB
MARILVVEDERDLSALLEYNLKQDGHTVSVANKGSEAIRLAELSEFDLVLLDLMLPDISGSQVAAALRAKKAAPAIIMLTARGEESDRIKGLEMGADDYVVKPFSVKELMLRVKNIIKRHGGPAAGSAVLRVGALEVDSERHEVKVNGEAVILTALEFKLLKTLMTRAGRLQTREVLLADVWNIDADITTRTVDTHIKRLREKLGAAGDLIETVRGVGYRMQEPL